MSRRSPSKKTLWLIIAAIPLAFIVFFLFKAYQFYEKIYQPHTQGMTIIKPTLPPEKTEFNILMMGMGGKGHDGSYLTDTIMVMHLDLKKKHAFLVSIPRDTFVSVPTKSGQSFGSKINAVYQMDLFPETYPDVKTDYKTTKDLTATKSVIKQVTGMDIDDYLTIDFTGFKKAIDIIGGVTVNVEKTFDDYEYPIDGKEDDLCGKNPDEIKDLITNASEGAQFEFPCRFEHLHFDKGPVTMDGATALKYVRSRHSLQDGTDFGRARRQQVFLEAVKDKVLNIGFIPKIIPLMDEISQHITTDISPDLLKKFLGEATHAKSYSIDALVLSNENFLENGYSERNGFILKPQAGEGNWDAVHQWIADSIAGITPTPTATASASLSVSPKISPKLTPRLSITKTPKITP